MKLPWGIGTLLGGKWGTPSTTPPAHYKSAAPATVTNNATSYEPTYFPLYRYRPMKQGEHSTTRFFPTVAYSQNVYNIGHPWCFEGFGDAFTMAITQLFKSEVSVMLANTAAGLAPNRSELLFNPDDGAWEVVNGNKVSVPGLDHNAASEINFPADAPRNAVTWPLLMGIISKIFDESRLGQKLRSITDLLCQLSDAEAISQPFEDNVYFCFMEDIVGSLLICGESEQDANCKETMSDYAYTREDFPDHSCDLHQSSLYRPYLPPSFQFHDPKLALPILFIDLLNGSAEKMLPRKIPDSVIIQESLTYLTLFRGLMIASSFSRKPFLCGAERIHPPILHPGWDVPFVVTSRQEGDPIFKEEGLKRDSLPIAFVSRSRIHPCAFVVTVRGTASMFEWSTDFEYGQVPFALDGNIRAHSGFIGLVNTIGPPIEAYITKETEKAQCACQDTHIIFSGHSLGAGVAQLLALYFAERYGLEACGADIAGAFYAPPRVFNSEGAERYRRIVNGRVLLDIGDGLAYMPCYDGNSANGWPRCTRGHMTTPGEGRDHYADNYGLVEIDVDYSDRAGGKGIDAVMQTLFPSGERNRPSTLATLLSKLFQVTIPGLNQVPSLGVLGAAHVCSVACKFSQAACGYDFQWWCDGCPMLL